MTSPISLLIGRGDLNGSRQAKYGRIFKISILYGLHDFWREILNWQNVNKQLKCKQKCKQTFKWPQVSHKWADLAEIRNLTPPTHPPPDGWLVFGGKIQIWEIWFSGRNLAADRPIRPKFGT